LYGVTVRRRPQSSCLCRGCTSNLELAVGWTAKPGYPGCHLPTQLKDVSVSTIPGALSALEALCDYALYKSTFTLHYTLHYIILNKHAKFFTALTNFAANRQNYLFAKIGWVDN